ncbi:tetratricopeptide repeat protein [Marinobacter salicampi]|uniref:tetratricopeptide repeat protein n=1 Tax=Marinobacter salicampi TaxID=435907 RepID=UPI001F5F61E6|nr:tetratricopeptide repeat protein [Marinobacter salicampi]
MKPSNSVMKSLPFARAALLSVAISVALVGCGDEDNMSQDEIQYMSHLDQSRFFQRQGELRASTLEARSAIDLQPANADPYFVIINNLLTAGDAVNAERQVDMLEEIMTDEVRTDTINNRMNLIRAKANRLRGNTDEALAHLDKIKDPDRSQEIEAALVRGDALLTARRLDEAELAYNRARELDGGSVDPLIGLSRVAYTRGDMEQAQALIEEAKEIDESEAELWLWRAQLAHSNEQWGQAEEAYIQALEDIGQFDVMTYRKYETISALVRVLREQGKASEAFVYEEILAKSAPGTIKSNLVAAQSAYNDGDLNLAARYLNEVLAQSPSHEQSALMLGMIRFRQGRTEEAARLLGPLAEAEDSEAASKLLAAARIQLRDPDEARRILDNLEDKDSDPGVLALVGIATLAGGDKQAGEELIRRSLEMAPDNNSLRIRFARYLVQEGETDQAIEQAQQVMERDPDSTDARVLMIQAHIASGDTNAAVESANAWVKEKPDEAQPKLARGELAMRMEDPADAKRYFEEAAAADQDDPRPRIALANLARSQDNTDEAASHYKAAVKLAPDNRQALQGLANTLGRDETAGFLGDIVENNEAVTGPRLILLEYALTNGDTGSADNQTAKLLETSDPDEPSELAPAVASVYNNVAGQKMRAEEFDQAQAILKRARALFPNNEDVMLQSASLAFRSDRESDGRDRLQEAKKAQPDSPRPFLLEAAYLTEQGRHKEAVENYQLALEKQRSPSTLLRYAQALQRAEQPNKAVEVLEEAHEASPNQPQISLALALAHQSAGNDDEAAEAYEALLRTEANNVVALNNLAWIYHEGDDDRALELAKRAYELSPESAAIADTYGWILFKMGQQAESITVLEKAHELEPQSEEIAMHLVDAYKAAGEEAKAKAVLQKI